MRDYQFGNFIYALRQEKKLSQSELGALVGVSNKAVSKWENGASKPSMDTIKKLSETFDVTVEELLAGRRLSDENSNFSEIEKEEFGTNITNYMKIGFIVGMCLCLCFCWISLFFIKKAWLIVVLLFITLAIWKVSITKIAYKYIHSILYSELNPPKYALAILSLSPSLTVKLTAAFYMGDYQTVINICNKQLKNQSKSKSKLYYLSLLAKVFFLCGDTEQLSTICAQADKIFPEKESLRNKFPIFSFYRLFLEQNYLQCLVYCETQQKALAPRSYAYKISSLSLKYNKAVVLFNMGEDKQSNTIFADIITEAPKMNFAMLAKQYTESRFTTINLLPDETFEVFDERAKKRIRKNRIVRTIITIFAIIILLVSIAFNLLNDSSKPSEDNNTVNNSHSETNQNEAIAEYEKALHSVLSKNYSEYKLLDYFNVYREGKVIDVLCLVENGGGIDVLSYCSQDGEKILLSRCDDLTPELENVISYLLDGTAVLMRIYTNEGDISDTVSIKEQIQYNNQTMYFCITFGE